MANIIVPSRRIWTRQPQQEVEVNRQHPLANWLVDVIDLRGVPKSLLLGTPLSIFGTGLAYGRPTKNGIGFDNTASFGGAYFQRNDGAYATAEQTHLTIGQYDVSSGFYAGYFCTADGSGASASMSLQSAAGADVLVYPGGNTYAGVEAALLGAGQLVLALASKPGATDIYKNGVLIGSGSNSPDVKTTSRLVILGERAASSGYSIKGKQLLHLFFNKKLSAAQIAALSENPWQIFRPQVRRSFFDMGAGGGGSTLNASASGSDIASGSADLSAQVALASVGVSTAGGSAALAASVPLSAVGLSVAAGSATPSATVTISASGLAQAAGQAGLSASVLAQAAGAALASGNATLAAQLNALATGAAQAGGSANLSGGAAGSLSASGAAIAAGTAVLSVTVGLQAAGSALASGTATGSANAPGQVSATGGATAGGSAVASVTASITAAGFVQAMGAGQLTISINLAAFGAALSSGSANLGQPGSGLETDPKFIIRAAARNYLIKAGPRNYTINRRSS